MTKFTTLFLVLAVTSCGTAPKNPYASPTTPNDTTAVTQQSVAATSTTASVTTSNSFYLAKKTDLWDCTDKLNRQLVYVAEESQFYYCNTTDWVAIDLKGAKGDKGESVTQTASTAVATNGKDGKDGKDGTNGLNGKDAVTIGPDTWLDPSTGNKWFMGMSVTARDVSNMSSVCSAPSVMPSRDDLKAAQANGLYEKFRTTQNYWVWVNIDTTTYGRALGVDTWFTNTPVGDGSYAIAMTDLTSADAAVYHRTLCVVKAK